MLSWFSLTAPLGLQALTCHAITQRSLICLNKTFHFLSFDCN